MVRSIVSAAALVLLASAAHADLDFTPHDSFYEIEGIRVPNLSFRNRGKVVPYSPPGGWHPSGRGKALTLIPPNTVQAGAAFEAVPAAKEPLRAVAGNIEAFRALAVELLPPEALKVEVISAAVSELQISSHPGVEVLLTYTFFGQPLTMTVLFIPHGEELLRLRLTARTGDFEPLAKMFRRSLYSLQGL